MLRARRRAGPRRRAGRRSCPRAVVVEGSGAAEAAGGDRQQPWARRRSFIMFIAATWTSTCSWRCKWGGPGLAASPCSAAGGRGSAGSGPVPAGLGEAGPPAGPLTGAARGPEAWLPRGSPVTRRCCLCLPSPTPGAPGCRHLFPSGLPGGGSAAASLPASPAAERCRGEGTGKGPRRQQQGQGCKLRSKRVTSVHGLKSCSAGRCFKAKIDCQFSANVSDNLSPAGATALSLVLGEGGELATLSYLFACSFESKLLLVGFFVVGRSRCCNMQVRS